MLRAKRMSTAQLVKPRIVTATLESVFERLAAELELAIKDNELGIDMIRDSKANGDKYDLHYQRFWMDQPKNIQDEGLHYSGKPLGWPLEIYANTCFGEPSIMCTVPASKLFSYCTFLFGLDSLAKRIAVGSFLPEHKVIGERDKKKIYQALTLADFSEVYPLLANHIKASL